jgi:hypothetical protein
MAVKKATEGTETVGNETAEEVTETKKEAVETENTESKTVKVIYIGPTLPELKTNRVLEGTEEEIKKELATIIEKYPLIEKMMVSIDDLAEKKEKVKTAGNILHKYYLDIATEVATVKAKED